MAHRKWNFDIVSPGLLPYAGVIAVVLIFSGCQKSEDDYQVITEEMSQPVAEETSLAESKTEDPMVDSKLSETKESPKSARPQSETETVASDESVTPTPAPDAQQPASTAPGTAAKPPLNKTVEVAQGSPKDQGGKKVNGFINLQAEIDRQKRMQKLGFGQTLKPSEPRKIKLLVKEREFFHEPKMDALRVTYNDLDLLKVLNMDPVPLNAQDYLPEWLTALDGKKVILRGWMFPPLQTEDLKGFIFVRDNQVCCFGPNAKAYDKLTVRLKKGNTTNYIQGRPFDVMGTFKIDAWVEDERDMRTGKFIEKLGMLYHIEDAVVVD